MGITSAVPKRQFPKQHQPRNRTKNPTCEGARTRTRIGSWPLPGAVYPTATRGTSMVLYFRSCLVAALGRVMPLFCVAQQASPESAGDQAPVFLSIQAPDSTATYPQSIN